MNKRKDPATLANFRFLPEHLKFRVKNFIDLLEDPYREFAVKRYLENKLFSEVAEEMGYSERTLYNIRDLIIDRWEFYIKNTKYQYERVKNRILRLVEKHGPLNHYTLSSNLIGYGYNRKELREIIDCLVESGYITCEVKHNTRGQPSKIYIGGSIS